MKKLWILLIGIMLISFAILGWIGTEIFRQTETGSAGNSGRELAEA